MKILIVNTYDRGGAANSCRRLHLGLLEKGIDSKVLLKHKQEDWPQSFTFVKPHKNRSLSKKLKLKGLMILKQLGLKPPEWENYEVQTSFLRNRDKRLEKFSFPNGGHDIMQSPFYQEADIINLHWTADFLDHEAFFVHNKKPVVLTLHDMNAFSGGEHYEEQFLGISKKGQPLARTKTPAEFEMIENLLRQKKSYFAKANSLTIVAPSQWLSEAAASNDVFKDRSVLCIPYGLNSEIFKPRDKHFARDFFNIPKDKKVVLFVAEHLTNNRKGLIFLLKAFEQLKDPDILLCAVGNKSTGTEHLENHIQLGRINDERMMSLAYSAADIFVIPSLMDNLPNTAIESMMCGTPVIGFPVGGIPEIIDHGANGYLTKHVSSDSLRDTLNLFFENQSLFQKEAISEKAKAHYNIRIQAENYKALFSQILASKKD